MAIRFPIRRPETNEVIHPDDLNKNIGEFVDELNGHIDGDNFAGVIASSLFKDDSFTKNYSDSYYGISTQYVCSNKTIGWTNKDGGDGAVSEVPQAMPSVEFIAPSDGWVIIDFNATFNWVGSGMTSMDGITIDLPSTRPPRGTPRGDLPPGGWIGVLPSDDPDIDLSGDRPVDRLHVLDNGPGNFQEKPAGDWATNNQIYDRYGVKFHVEVNGVEISETGWLYNGAYFNGVYLCGAMPVTAGKNIIKSEVKAAALYDLKSHPAGIGAIFDGSSGKYTPKKKESSRAAESPLPPLVESDTNVDGARPTTGIECRVTARNLIVQYRKR